ncbi:invasion plasmid antigen IpaD [Iodobacter fluviatilis]|uniref:Translocator protein BipD n=2 Tax=Iodobacter fluviatilis TaxID=537 RepID=A0A377Q5W6_9NEIS|nr:invasion plasmid antigen IpaD [Iodobacter fluviatilis]STQ90145.1 Salmonella invasion protein D [Iodobacter fluviatilis]
MSIMSAVELRRNASSLSSQQTHIENPVFDTPLAQLDGVETWGGSVARVEQALHNIAVRPEGLKVALEEQASAEQVLQRNVREVYSQLPAESAYLRDNLPPELRALQHEGGLRSNADSMFKLMSDREILEMISDHMVDIKGNYQKIFANATSKYADFFKDFSTTITKLAGYFSARDTTDMIVNVDSLQNDLLDVMLKHKNEALVSCDTEQEAKYWAKELGLAADADILGSSRPAYVKMKDRKWCVYPNLEPLVQILVASNYNNSGTKVPMSLSPKYGVAGAIRSDAYTMNSGRWADAREAKLNNTIFQSWQTAHSTQKEQIQSTVQVLAEKFGRANSLYDNIVKVLSSMTSSLEEAAKNALRF